MPEEKACYTLTGAAILTLDQDRSFFPDGMLIVEGDRICYVGALDRERIRGGTISMTGKLILPGLVNTHAHSGSSLFKSLADDLFLMDWLEHYMWPAEKFQTAQFSQIASALTHLEFLKNGITTHADMWIYGESTAAAALQSGLRSVICPTVFSRPSTETDDPLARAAAFVEKYRGRENETRIYPGFAPHAVYTCTQETLRETAALAKRYGVLLHTHISETREENRACQERLRCSPTQAMQEAGCFETHVLAAHCVHMRPQDYDIFAENSAAVSYNPVSNMKLCSGVMDMTLARSKQVCVSIGTDGSQSNNSLDLLRDLKSGILLQKVHLENPSFLPAEEALRMAVIDGATALGLQHEIGSLEIGKKADLITFDLNSPEFTPAHMERPENLHSLIVYSACGSNVCDVFVDGEWLMKDRIPLRVDETQILKEARQAAAVQLRSNGL